MKKLLFIVNPVAGQRKITRYLPIIITIFNEGGYEVTIYTTTGSGSARQIAAQRAADYDLVVCAGGDGTLNETINGVLGSGADVPIGYIPAGSTNDFAASLSLPVSIPEAAKAIVTGEPVQYDVGQFAGRYFSYVASFGAFTRVSYSTPQNIKNALGHVAYLLEGIQELAQIHSTHIRFELDDGEVIEDDFVFGAICNSTSLGGLLTLDPKQVDMRDGKFELMLVRLPRDANQLRDCILALQSQRYNCSVITFRPVSRVRIYPNPEMVWTLDGERAEGSEMIDVVNLHHAIRLIRGKETADA